ncbi:MAG: HD domain-containing phosphohydrolase [Bacillota bacterium]|jgi:diguanylate cyclase (GGDEF)-like protein/PAS domain S-box-containing protein
MKKYLVLVPAFLGSLLFFALITVSEEVMHFFHAALGGLLFILAAALFMLTRSLKELMASRGETRQRGAELEQANQRLAEHEAKLQLILDSTAEAIFGVDVDGRCTFCNASFLRMLGYADAAQLIGKQVHSLIHHSRRDGTPMPLEECSIYQTLLTGTGARVDDEVFWRADGSHFDVEYASYPQLVDGKVVGGVVSFTDITERKQAEAQIKYLSLHDPVTGLYNRSSFEAGLQNMENEFPVSLILADVNGLKLTNDVFGHAAGDELIRKVGEVFRRVCREHALAARIGGDEFALILPGTGLDEARQLAIKIQEDVAREKVMAIRGSISLGVASKTEPAQEMAAVFRDAESEMYLQKTLQRSVTNAELIGSIIDTLHQRVPLLKEHSQRVSQLCERLGYILHLGEDDVRRLRDAGYLHDIGKIVLSEQLLKAGRLVDIDQLAATQHVTVGYRILQLFEETADIAEAVLYHEESWDGSGLPKGLRGEEIPLLARIIAVADNFVDLTCCAEPSALYSEPDAVQEIAKQAGRKFDPAVVDAFLALMRADNTSGQ